jgi:NAD(P)-dependent dehydrogenase (short-subunit alcohol dehydrogenase family)
VITGGATGIGRAAAMRFIEEGAFVFIFGRRQNELDAAPAEIGAVTAFLASSDSSFKTASEVVVDGAAAAV